jgi:hypothetical protein
MRMTTASGRSRWPLVIVGVVLILGVSGVIAFTMAQPPSEPLTAPTSSAPSATMSPPPTDGGSGMEDDVAPTGCLGGPDRNANMVLSAQEAAKHSTYGAVEVATAFYRWLWQSPYPAASEGDAVSARVIASTAVAGWKDLSAQYTAAGDDLTKGIVAPGTPFHVSTTNGLWRVTEDSNSDRVNVELAVGYVVNGELSPTKVAGIGLVMLWEDGEWHVESGSLVDETKLANGGNRYTGGC